MLWLQNKNRLMRLYFILILILFLISFISSLEIGINPAHIELYGNKGDTICKNVSIYSDKDITVLFDSRWSESENSRNINDYKLKSEEIAIELHSPNRIFLAKNKEKDVEVCFKCNKKGDFYGAILFESENGYASVGSWVHIKINNDNSITGGAIGIVKDNDFLFIGIFGLIIELGLIFYLIKRIKHSKN